MPQFCCHHAVAVDAECAQIRNVTFAAAFHDRDNVVGIPKALPAQALKSPYLQQCGTFRSACAAEHAVGGESIHRATRANPSVSLEHRVSQIGGAGAQAPGMHTFRGAEGAFARWHFLRAPSTQTPTAGPCRYIDQPSAPSRHRPPGTDRTHRVPPRLSGTMRIAYFGRSVIFGCTSIFCPGTSRRRHC